jgi:CBS domain-containing protein
MLERLSGGPAEPDFVDPLSCYDRPAYRDEVESALAELLVSDVKTVPLAMIDAHARAGSAVQHLAEHHIACLMVMDGEQLVGVFTERDVLLKLAESFEDWHERPVREFMTPRPAIIYDTDSVASAVCVLAVQGYRHVPVLDADDQVIGIVSPNRVLDFLQRQLESV